MAVPTLGGDLLPLGRHQVTLEELRAAFVDDARYAGSRSRPVIWEHFKLANELLQSAVVVHSAWIGGSFTTAKIDPRDIDVVYVVDLEDRVARSRDERQIVEAFVKRQKDPLSGRQVPLHGLLVDSFVLDWAPHIKRLSESADYQAYACWRGYWDDFWARRRTGSKKDPAVRSDALPARGYLEVQFSAYA